MNRKDFDIVAKALKGERPNLIPEQNGQWLNDCIAIADAMSAACAHFDRAKFLERCGVKS